MLGHSAKLVGQNHAANVSDASPEVRTLLVTTNLVQFRLQVEVQELWVVRDTYPLANHSITMVHISSFHVKHDHLATDCPTVLYCTVV